jgi:hypothetical protein
MIAYYCYVTPFMNVEFAIISLVLSAFCWEGKYIFLFTLHNLNDVSFRWVITFVLFKCKGVDDFKECFCKIVTIFHSSRILKALAIGLVDFDLHPLVLKISNFINETNLQMSKHSDYHSFDLLITNNCDLHFKSLSWVFFL